MNVYFPQSPSKKSYIPSQTKPSQGYPPKNNRIEGWDGEHFRANPKSLKQLIGMLVEEIDELYLKENWEERSIKKHRLFLSIVNAVKREVDAEDSLEELLDRLFVDLRKGEVFEHTELVIFVLFAMKVAEVNYFSDIAQVFARNKSAELGQVSRFSQRQLES